MLHLTNEQKLNKLKEIGNIIEMDKINNNGFVSDKIKTFTIGALFIIDECNESWCDSCPVHHSLGHLCSELSLL